MVAGGQTEGAQGAGRQADRQTEKGGSRLVAGRYGERADRQAVEAAG